jgi:hypothetical protein
METLFLNSYWLQLGLGTGLPALLILLVPHKWLWRAMIGWLFAPLVVLIGALIREAVMRADQPDAGAELIHAAQFLIPPVAIIWGIVSVIGFAIGFALRALIRPKAAQPITTKSARNLPVVPSEPALIRPPGPRPALVQQGGLQVESLAVEWGGNGRWIHGPRVTVMATGATLFDLWDTSADASATFPAQGVVRLDVFLYAERRSYLVTIDLPHQSYRIDGRTEGDGRRIEGRLADLPMAFEKATFPPPDISSGSALPQPRPNPAKAFVAWRSALLILVCALGLIGTIAVILRNAEHRGLTVTPLTPMPRPLN